jgi:putative ABC transport system ATP-binding protein
MTAPLLAFDDVSKTFRSADRVSRDVLKAVSFAIQPGVSVALVGRSGSGKSTLLHLAAGIELPTSGRITLAGHELSRLDEAARTVLRRDTVGLVFQFFHLLPHLSVEDNVALPGWIAGRLGGALQARIAELLARVDLLERRRETVQKLSGGEMQRVAICRALLHRPRLILADEPTGSLDDEHGRAVMDLLLRLVREEGGTLLFATHSRELAARADAVWRLQSGVLRGALARDRGRP